MTVVNVFRATAGNNSKRCALLLGWTGGSLRHVAKHSTMWNKIGVSAVVTDITLQETFLPRDQTKLRDKARRLLDISTTELQAEEVVIHMFSNGGCLLFLSLLEELAERQRHHPHAPRLPSIVGTIYDSSPVPMIHPVGGPITTLLTGLSAKEKLSAMYNLVPYAITSTLLHPFRGNPLGWFGGLRNPAINSTDWPQLMLYSGGDWIVPASQVEEFAAVRESQGTSVNLHRFPDDSPHVKHYRNRPGDYEEVVTKWLSEKVSWCVDNE